MEEEKKSGYGKRPLWQWILLYVVVGGLLYVVVYHFYFAKKGGYSYTTNTDSNPVVSQSPTSEVMAATNSSFIEVFMTKSHPTKSEYLADTKGMTLYTYDKDTSGVSNCYDECATVWPPYIVDEAPPANLPAHTTTVQRTDGSYVFALKGMPLYFYAKDTKPGDVNGDGVGGVWHLVKP